MTALTIVELFPGHLAVNGDMGNVTVLRERLRLAGIDSTHIAYHPGDELPESCDIVTIGTGPVSALRVLEPAVASIGETLRRWRDDGVAMLAVTAGMQILGRSISLPEGGSIEGAGVFDIATDATVQRVVTNCFAVDTALGRLIGIENHGSITSLGADERFGTAASGRGNGSARDEGVRASNAIGTHLQGPALAMNPVLADHLIELASARAGIDFTTNDGHAKLDSLARQCRVILGKSAGLAVDRPAA